MKAKKIKSTVSPAGYTFTPLGDDLYEVSHAGEKLTLPRHLQYFYTASWKILQEEAKRFAITKDNL